MIRHSMQGMRAADVERWSSRVVVVRGLNPGPFTGPGTNTYLVGEGTRPILIDTGAGIEGYVPLLERALREEFGAKAPGEIVLTHGHPDHRGGVPALLEHFGPLRVSKLRRSDHPEDEACAPAREEQVFATEGATLRALHCPGHAEDHLCFLLQEERALFTGDVVLGAGTTVIPLDGGDMGHYLASLRRILELPLDRIYPGHGPRIDEPGARVREYIAHRQEREEQILEAIRSGASTVTQVVERVYTETPQALHPAAAQSVVAHLRKLEGEKRARQRIDAGGEAHWSVG